MCLMDNQRSKLNMSWPVKGLLARPISIRKYLAIKKMLPFVFVIFLKNVKQNKKFHAEV
jgi:hypothetical protein